MSTEKKLFQLKKTGPYNQISTPGFLGMTSYSIPKENPVDSSFMPACEKGPCGGWSQRWNEHEGRMIPHCDFYLEPTRIPQKTDWFAESPEKNRKSCSYPFGEKTQGKALQNRFEGVPLSESDVTIFGQKIGQGRSQGKYWVYWDEDPNSGKKNNTKINTKNYTKNYTKKMNTNAKPLSVTIGSKGLDKTGPYIQNETPGMFGKSYSMPDKNPEDGSYMPQCGEGECLKTSRRRDGIMGDSATCEKRADPNSMPPNPTNPTGPKPKSCAIPDPNNSMFGEQKYYVYWDKLPENLESKKVASGRVIKRTGPYEIKPMPFLFGSTIATLPQKNPIDDSIMPPCGDDCASELWWYDSRKGRSSRNQLTKVCERYHTHPYKIDEIDMPDSNNQGYTSSTTKKLPKSCSKPIGHNEGIVMNPTHPEHYYVYWNQDPDTLLKSKKNIATSNVKARKSRRKIRN